MVWRVATYFVTLAILYGSSYGSTEKDKHHKGYLQGHPLLGGNGARGIYLFTKQNSQKNGHKSPYHNKHHVHKPHQSKDLHYPGNFHQGYGNPEGQAPKNTKPKADGYFSNDFSDQQGYHQVLLTHQDLNPFPKIHKAPVHVQLLYRISAKKGHGKNPQLRVSDKEVHATKIVNKDQYLKEQGQHANMEDQFDPKTTYVTKSKTNGFSYQIAFPHIKGYQGYNGHTFYNQVPVYSTPYEHLHYPGNFQLHGYPYNQEYAYTQGRLHQLVYPPNEGVPHNHKYPPKHADPKTQEHSKKPEFTNEEGHVQKQGQPQIQGHRHKGSSHNHGHFPPILTFPIDIHQARYKPLLPKHRSIHLRTTNYGFPHYGLTSQEDSSSESSSSESSSSESSSKESPSKEVEAVVKITDVKKKAQYEKSEEKTKAETGYVAEESAKAAVQGRDYVDDFSGYQNGYSPVAPNVLDNNFCEGIADGNFANPGLTKDADPRCTYITCAGYRTHLFNCAPGTFNGRHIIYHTPIWASLSLNYKGAPHHRFGIYGRDYCGQLDIGTFSEGPVCSRPMNQIWDSAKELKDDNDSKFQEEQITNVKPEAKGGLTEEVKQDIVSPKSTNDSQKTPKAEAEDKSMSYEEDLAIDVYNDYSAYKNGYGLGPLVMANDFCFMHPDGNYANPGLTRDVDPRCTYVTCSAERGYIFNCPLGSFNGLDYKHHYPLWGPEGISFRHAYHYKYDVKSYCRTEDTKGVCSQPR